MLPRAEIKRYDVEVENEYKELGARRRELQAELKSRNGEINTILANLGELVASGKGFEQKTARLAKLRLETEAFEAAVKYVANQQNLLKRINSWLRDGRQ